MSLAHSAMLGSRSTGMWLLHSLAHSTMEGSGMYWDVAVTFSCTFYYGGFRDVLGCGCYILLHILLWRVPGCTGMWLLHSLAHSAMEGSGMYWDVAACYILLHILLLRVPGCTGMWLLVTFSCSFYYGGFQDVLGCG